MTAMSPVAPGLPLDVLVRGSGPPVVLLHGFAGNRTTWRFWAGPLAERYEAHLVDAFGCGAAPFPADDQYGPRAQGDALVAYLRANDLRDVTLIGHSLGGGVALYAALRLAELGEVERVRALVSVAGAAYAQAIPGFIALFRVPGLGRALLGVLGPDRAVPWVLREIVYDAASVTREQIEGYAAPLRDARRRRAIERIARQIVPPGIETLERTWRTIQTPTLLLWGRHDPVVPLWVGERLAGEMPHAELVVLERCGHIVPEERPDESVARVIEFLERVRP